MENCGVFVKKNLLPPPDVAIIRRNRMVRNLRIARRGALPARKMKALAGDFRRGKALLPLDGVYFCVLVHSSTRFLRFGLRRLTSKSASMPPASRAA